MLFLIYNKYKKQLVFTVFMASNNKSKTISSHNYSSYSYNGFLNDENKMLRNTITELREEVQRFRTPSLMVAEVFDTFDDTAIIRLPNGNKFLVNISKNVDELRPGDAVAVEQRNLTVVKKINTSKNFDVEKFVILEKPNITWDEVGGLAKQMQLIKEVVELPLISPELFKAIGINPPKGILLYGPPGTGKTLLGKAVANATNSTFIQVVASELVQKFIGEGAKLVKEIFALAREKAPSIVFVDELDALASKRIEVGTSGEREVQRTFMQFLSEIDGFHSLDNVKIIGCTNRIDILDPAILRPGRLDRLIEVPLPKDEAVRQIFDIHTRQMPLAKCVDKDEVCSLLNGLSGAEIQATCTEAGYEAIRKKQSLVKHEDFLNAFKRDRKHTSPHKQAYLRMFG